MPGAIGFSGIWKEIGDVGVVDAVKSESLRIWGYYWFLVPGFLMILYGLLCHWIENHLSRPLPSFAGWGLLAVAGFGIVLDIVACVPRRHQHDRGLATRRQAA
jgi:hypothetical protein